MSNDIFEKRAERDVEFAEITKLVMLISKLALFNGKQESGWPSKI